MLNIITSISQQKQLKKLIKYHKTFTIINSKLWQNGLSSYQLRFPENDSVERGATLIVQSDENRKEEFFYYFSNKI